MDWILAGFLPASLPSSPALFQRPHPPFGAALTRVAKCSSPHPGRFLEIIQQSKHHEVIIYLPMPILPTIVLLNVGSSQEKRLLSCGNDKSDQIMKNLIFFPAPVGCR